MSSEVATLERRALVYRDYPEELKAAVINAIQANGGNVLATAKLFNLSRDTVYYWWRNSDRFVEIQHASGNDLADKLERIAHSYADSLAEHDQSIVSAKDKATIISASVDKMQLLRGQPTSVTVNVERQELSVVLSNVLDE